MIYGAEISILKVPPNISHKRNGFHPDIICTPKSSYVLIHKAILVIPRRHTL
jgi:hypothetical protein